MESIESCLLKYRHAIREMLFDAGVVTNLGIADNQLLDHLSVKITGHPIEWIKCPQCEARFPHLLTVDAHVAMDHK